VKHDADIGILGSAAPGDAAPAPRSLDTMGLGVSGLHLSVSPNFSPSPIDWRQVGDKVESTCSHVATTEMLLHKTLASVNQNILRPIWVGLKREKKPPAHLRLPSCFLIPSCILFLQLLSQGSMDVPAFQVEVTRALEVVATTETIRIVVVLAVETSAQEAAVARDSAALHVKDAEDWASPTEREAWERVLRMEAGNAVVIAFAREDAEGLVQKIALREGELAEVCQA
jgi:hypothetical protein